MNIEPKPVAGAVKETLHATILKPCGETELRKAFLDGDMDLFARDPVADHSESNILALFDSGVELF